MSPREHYSDYDEEMTARCERTFCEIKITCDDCCLLARGSNPPL